MTKLFKHSAGMALGLLLLMSTAAHADISPATVLAINTDTSNTKLYVEVSYVGRPCLIYQLKFGIGVFRVGVPDIIGDTLIAQAFKVVTGAGDAVVWRDGDAAPISGYITKTQGDVTRGDTLMYDMQISGYRLEFDLLPLTGGRVLPSDSIHVCLRSQMAPILCEGCGTAGSDRMFSLNDIATDCPYDYQNKEDMIACYHRDSKVQNWEGWIADARDCKKYRIVQMPDGKWWMAQNLNFQGTDGNKLTFYPSYPIAVSPLNTYNGIFWCPSDVVNALDTLPLNNKAFADATGSLAACETYGALYPALTILTKDGRNSGVLDVNSSDLMQPVRMIDSTLISGICPEGWAIPTHIHWGRMVNLVEKNCENKTAQDYGCTTTGDNSNLTTGFPMLANDSVFHYNPCKHIDTSTVVERLHASLCAYKDLLSTNVAPYREMDTAQNYIGSDESAIRPYNLKDNRRLLTAPKRIKRYATATNPVWSYYLPETAGTDKYGFSILPTGSVPGNNQPLYLFGEYAGFWTSSSDVIPIVSTYSDNFNKTFAFLYNVNLNSIMPHGILHSRNRATYGQSLRCIANDKK